jgi:hypothetical protein
MKFTEKLISPFIQSQFPAFYEEEGPQFIAFIKAYYEWMETEGQAIYQTRRLTEYRDIDSTLEDFVLYFKEKYLKNIQFDLATNKKLLVKNSLDLYRSKGTERAVDLFFKLVYGTDAEVRYPADKIMRLSDGIWELPLYLEVSYSKYNIDYIGKQIVGSLSGATAFVEKYIRRRTDRGYVNILFISNIQGSFRNGEVLGVNVNSSPVFDSAKNARMIGSLDRVEIETKGVSFKVGDIVNFSGSSRGLGGQARVAAVSNATGIIDFIFMDGGYGYTVDATSLISEKVLNFGTIVANTISAQYFRLFEELVQPVINVNFTSATLTSPGGGAPTIAVGDKLFRYSSGTIVGSGVVIDVSQNKANGDITISHTNGSFVNSSLYYSTSNTYTLYANTIEDRTIAGKVMGIPETYVLTVEGLTDSLTVGQSVYQRNTSSVYAHGIVGNVVDNSYVTVINARGAFKNSIQQETAFYSVGTGTITSTINSAILTGSGTAFSNNYLNAVIYQTPNTTTNVAIGTIESIINSTAVALTSNASVAVTANAHSYGLKYHLQVEGNSSLSANILTISASAGLYSINKFVNKIKYTGANNDTILNSPFIYQYYSNGAVSAKGQVLTASFDSSVANTGNVSIIPLSGYFLSTKKVYTQANTCNATVVAYSSTVTGGDYIDSPYARLVTQISNTATTLSSIGYGSGAAFEVSTIGDAEVIFIGTDQIGANGAATLDYDRKNLAVSSSTGFAIADRVYQTVNKIAFNSSSAVDSATGFITIPNANTIFTVGDNIKYEVATGNTVPTGLVSGDYYHVRFANTSGLKLSYPYRKRDYINNVNFPGFADNKVSETGHYLYKLIYGTVFETGSGLVRIQDRLNYFGSTGGTTTTTTTSNSNLIKYGTNTTNTTITNVTAYSTIVQANQAYAALPIRSPAFGFPKNPQGDIADTIYSCLNFGRFEIGSIGALAGVNPGAEYNQDPYVLAYQPYISAFNRNDFLINIDPATSVFIVGEKINQTQANLVYYDLQVPYGVYSNNYSEVSRAINSHDDVSGNFILVPSNTVSFDSSAAVNSTADSISIPNANTIFTVNDLVRYYTNTGNTVISGLSNASLYYVSFSNSSAISLSTTPSGANVNITAAVTGEVGHNIKNYVNPHANNVKVIYSTLTGNTVIGGLSNNGLYYTVSANSVGFSLSTTYGGSAVALTANATTGEQQYIATVPGYLPNDKVYQNVSGTIANASVQSVYTDPLNGHQFVRVRGNTNPLATNQILFSYTNPYVNSTVSSVSMYQITSTAKGIIKAGSNTSVLRVKRLNFENTFKAGQEVIGDASGAIANVLGVSEDDNELYPIGLNADIQANVVTANGQVTSLQIIDSGVGYVNSEIITFTSTDGKRSGSVKVIIDGNGKSKGYYRSSKGFLSEDMYIHDGDYYQEYSYEILSKMSFDKYADMFKKVMHVAGTKFFGSAQVIESGTLPLTLTELGTGLEIAFNSATDVDSPTDRIKVNIEKDTRAFDPLANVNQVSEFITLKSNPFSNGDLVLYYTSVGNTVLQGLANNGFYYVRDANTTGIKLAVTVNGTAIDLNNQTAVSERGHFLRSYINPLANGDLVYYSTATGNTVLSGLVNATSYYVTSTTPASLQLSSSALGTPVINITASGSPETGHYLSRIIEETN